MDGHPFTAIPNILRSVRVARPGEVLCLVWEELAFENVSDVRGHDGGGSLQGAKVNRRNSQDVFRVHAI